MTSRSAPGSSEGDAGLQALMAQPFVVARPKRQSTPFVFASPHSGNLYPSSFTRASPLDALVLRQSEDAFVDELFATAPELGAPLISAQFPRAYVDANRAVNEIDAAMFDAVPALPMAARTARVAAGLGVIPRMVRDGLEIYRDVLPAREAVFRLDNFYRPYHAALAGLVEKTVSCFGLGVVIDCHSMPSSARIPDIVIGDHYGEAATAELVVHARECLQDAGFSVGYNVPYAGGHTTLTYGKPANGLNALQIEINRALYLDEARMEKLPAFDDCRNRLFKVIETLIAADPALFSRPRESKRERA